MLTHSFLRRPDSALRHLHSSVGHRRSPMLVAAMAASVLGLALLTSMMSVTSASAHAQLVKITPMLNSQLSTAPTQVVLEFNEPLSSSFATVVVTTAAGVSATVGKPKVVGAKVTQALSPDLRAGAYRVAYRVVSADGHPVTGQSRFMLTLAAATTPATSVPSAPPATTPAPTTPPATVGHVTPTQSPDGGPVGGQGRPTMPIAGAVGLVVVAAGVLFWWRRRP